MAIKVESFSLVFWDFDGTIKDSVDVKTNAFEQLFQPFGSALTERVRAHHEAYGGVSRFKKIPLYLEWAGESFNDNQVEVYCDRFSELVMQGVIDSPWVAGVQEYLSKQYEQQYFVLVTATPQEEIQFIIDKLEVAHYFREVYGAPQNKSESIASVMKRLGVQQNMILMIGDTESDLSAAQGNNISFLLRRTPINQQLQRNYSGPQCDHLAI